MGKFICSVAIVLALAPWGAGAATLPEIMVQIMAVMPGTYDTADQVNDEIVRGIPEAQRHERRHVIYARIDAPQIGPYIFFRQERKGGPEGEIITRGVVVFEPDESANGIRMWLRNIPDPVRFTDLHLKKDLWAQVTFDPTYGGKCPFHWRLAEGKLVGTLQGGGCKIISNAGKAMSFDATWTSTQASLSVFDNTYDGDRKLLSGRADKVATLYTRLKP